VSTTAVEVRGLRKLYRNVAAVDGVSFTVARGRSLAIVGESGSGKTTTARIIVGLEKPTEGEVILDGVPRGYGRLGSRARRRLGREVQIVFQDPYSSLDPRQRIGSGLDELIRVHEPSLTAAARADRTRELMHQVGLDDRHERSFPRQMSGGQRQRVAIARALACRPKVLILDEAVASLDVSIQAQVLNLLADIRERTSITYLFISHDLAVVRQVSDEVAVMRRGQIVESGPTDDVLDNPQHPYTQALLDAIPSAGWTTLTEREQA
jgi:oligopeptide transport system ATP-binding protein